MPEDGGWGSARGPAKHFQACYYFILRSRALTSETNQSETSVLLPHLTHLASSDSFWLLQWIDVTPPPVAAELWSCRKVWAGINRAGHQASIKMSITLWYFDCASAGDEMFQCVACTAGCSRLRASSGHTRCMPENHAVCPSVSIGHFPSASPSWAQANAAIYSGGQWLPTVEIKWRQSIIFLKIMLTGKKHAWHIQIFTGIPTMCPTLFLLETN